MRFAERTVAQAVALLLASGCAVAIDVGQEGTGGSASGGGASAGTSGQPTGGSCQSPAALLCPWGFAGGPCGGGLPESMDCDPTQGWICSGASPGTPGTCITPGQKLQVPGGPCGPGVPDQPPCPWNYQCDAPDMAGSVGMCVPGSCVLGDGTAPVSVASVTIDGDGPTQHYDYACASPYFYGSSLTGEAVGFPTIFGTNPRPGFEIVACKTADGNSTWGGIQMMMDLTDIGTTQRSGTVEYFGPPRPPFMGGGPWYQESATDPVTFTITELTPDSVKGSYDVMVKDIDSPYDSKHLTGTFDVCRLPFYVSLPRP
jgi:hypothetical protein